jgi:hypothetical protein
MAETIVDGTQFNAANIKFTAPKANASNGKSVNILNKHTNTGLRLSTPLMLTWGASDFKDEKSGLGNGKFEMALQFPSSEYPSEDASAFLANMQALEKKIKSDALVYSKEWFGKVHSSPDVIDALWTPMLKYGKDKTTGESDLSKAPTLRIKLPVWEGNWRCEIYDEDGNTLFPNPSNPVVTPVDFLQKGINVALVMQCGGLWFANGKFGITWKLIQAVVQRPRASLTGTCFIKLKAADKERLKAAAPQLDTDAADGVESGAIVEDSDEEEEVEEEEDEPPKPAPKPVPVPEPEPEPAKKKIVRKKV